MLLSADGTLKIVDFGVSEIFSKGKNFDKVAGSPAFYAPEMCGSNKVLK
jgi:calcium/calmodulin-dependent protein kinase kinase 2